MSTSAPEQTDDPRPLPRPLQALSHQGTLSRLIWITLGALMAALVVTLILTSLLPRVPEGDERSWALVLAMLVFSLLLAWLTRRWHHNTELSPWRSAPAAMGLPAVGAVLVCVIVAWLCGQGFGMATHEALLEAARRSGQHVSESPEPTGLQLPAWTLISALVVAPVLEESVRVWFYSSARAGLGLGGATVVASLPFVLLHLNAVQMVGTIALSVLLCWLYERTRSLAWTIGAHAGFNLISVLLPHPPEVISHPGFLAGVLAAVGILVVYTVRSGALGSSDQLEALQPRRGGIVSS